MKYVALLRGINVGGTGLLPMKDLAALCEGLGLASVRTYIQSGNVIFESKLSEAKGKNLIERALEKRMGKKISVMLRSQDELQQILSANPFDDKEPARVGIHFLDSAPPADLLKKVVAPAGEQVHIGVREVYVFYPIGMGQSKLKMQFDGPATVRNVNTVAKLAELCEG